LVKILISVIILLFSNTLAAKVSPDDQKLLAQELTPFGAVRAGNDGLIPEWTDKTAFIENQQPLYIINEQNHTQYKANLTAGQIALFERYPDSFQMPVYPSQRTFTAPTDVFENTYKNALTASLNSDESGFVNALAGIPFPVPQSALEVYFNHISRWRGRQIKKEIRCTF